MLVIPKLHMLLLYQRWIEITRQLPALLVCIPYVRKSIDTVEVVRFAGGV